MIYLVTLAQAKEHVNITDTDHDSEVESRLLQASAIAMQYMQLAAIPAEWMVGSPATTTEAPYDVQAAVLLMCGELFYNREAGSANVMSDAVKSLLRAYRMPTIA